MCCSNRTQVASTRVTFDFLSLWSLLISYCFALTLSFHSFCRNYFSWLDFMVVAVYGYGGGLLLFFTWLIFLLLFFLFQNFALIFIWRHDLLFTMRYHNYYPKNVVSSFWKGILFLLLVIFWFFQSPIHSKIRTIIGKQ